MSTPGDRPATATPRPATRAERRRADYAAEMRADIIEAAIAEFAERGYHATTIAAIAVRLEVSPGTIYNYFKNKREIVDHVVDGLTAQVMSALTAENAPGLATTADEYRAQSRRIAVAVDEIFAADLRVPRLLLFEATSIDPAMTARALGMFDLAGRLAAAYLQHGVDQGFLRDDIDVAATADAVSGMILSIALRSLSSDLGAKQRETMRETVIDVLMTGVARPR